MGGETSWSNVTSQLLGLAPVWVHAPDLHASAAEGVVVNEFSVGRIVRAIIESAATSEASFLPALDRNCVYVPLVIPASHIGESPSVGRPSVPEARCLRRDFHRSRAACYRNDVDARREPVLREIGRASCR